MQAERRKKEFIHFLSRGEAYIQAKIKYSASLSFTLQLGKKFSNYGISIFLLAMLLNLRAKGIRNLTKRNGNSISISLIIQVVFQDDHWK